MKLNINLYSKFISLFILFVGFSCIPKKDLIYLQENPYNRYSGMEEDITLDEFDYVLQPGDRISLRVFSLTSNEYNFFSGGADNIAAPLEFQIDNEGNIELPVAEKIRLSGKTQEEARQDIQSVLSNYLKAPVVQLELIKNFEFTVIGESGNGKYALPKIQVNILEALATAGGLNDFSDRSRIKIVRQEGDRKTVYLVNVLDENLIRTKDYYIKSGDIIIVDTKRNKPKQPFILSLINPIFALTNVVFIISRFVGGN